MPMTSREIKAALVSADVKHVAVARNAGFSPQLVSEVIAGNRRNEKIESEIADAIGRPVTEVFPVEQQPASASTAA